MAKQKFQARRRRRRAVLHHLRQARPGRAVCDNKNSSRGSRGNPYSAAGAWPAVTASPATISGSVIRSGSTNVSASIHAASSKAQPSPASIHAAGQAPSAAKALAPTNSAEHSTASGNQPIHAPQWRQRPRSAMKLSTGTRSIMPSVAPQPSQRERPRIKSSRAGQRRITTPSQLPMIGPRGRITQAKIYLILHLPCAP
jgi:hypothetical protein